MGMVARVGLSPVKIKIWGLLSLFPIHHQPSHLPSHCLSGVWYCVWNYQGGKLLGIGEGGARMKFEGKVYLSYSSTKHIISALSHPFVYLSV